MPDNEKIIEKSDGTIWNVVSQNDEVVTLSTNLSSGVSTKRVPLLKKSENYADVPDIRISNTPQMHPMYIELRCPNCGKKLVNTCYTKQNDEVIRYYHECNSWLCNYKVSVRSIYSGMYVAVTDEQEKKLMDWTYDENIDGKLIEITPQQACMMQSGKNLTRVIN
ncbi:hypothetical protein [uncultured Methanobrevibacter sp.]|uniref:hypothetical protein n=1 Tax=uncultured Methanobrevibacter sp. TaxID=253161 RepID=UPI0025CC2C1E|nr:hypothetical protein [uncultured Methanobrevibacter sp.]